MVVTRKGDKKLSLKSEPLENDKNISAKTKLKGTSRNEIETQRNTGANSLRDSEKTPPNPNKRVTNRNNSRKRSPASTNLGAKKTNKNAKSTGQDSGHSDSSRFENSSDEEHENRKLKELKDKPDHQATNKSNYKKQSTEDNNTKQKEKNPGSCSHLDSSDLNKLTTNSNEDDSQGNVPQNRENSLETAEADNTKLRKSVQTLTSSSLPESKNNSRKVEIQMEAKENDLQLSEYSSEDEGIAVTRYEECNEQNDCQIGDSCNSHENKTLNTDEDNSKRKSLRTRAHIKYVLNKSGSEDKPEIKLKDDIEVCESSSMASMNASHRAESESDESNFSEETTDRKPKRTLTKLSSKVHTPQQKGSHTKVPAKRRRTRVDLSDCDSNSKGGSVERPKENSNLGKTKKNQNAESTKSESARSGSLHFKNTNDDKLENWKLKPMIQENIRRSPEELKDVVMLKKDNARKCFTEKDNNKHCLDKKASNTESIASGSSQLDSSDLNKVTGHNNEDDSQENDSIKKSNISAANDGGADNTKPRKSVQSLDSSSNSLSEGKSRKTNENSDLQLSEYSSEDEVVAGTRNEQCKGQVDCRTGDSSNSHEDKTLKTVESLESNSKRKALRTRTPIKYVQNESESDGEASDNSKKARRRFKNDIEVCESSSVASIASSESESEESSFSEEPPDSKPNRTLSKLASKVRRLQQKASHRKEPAKKRLTRVDLSEMDSNSIDDSVKEKMKQRQFDGLVRYFFGADGVKDVQISQELLQRKKIKGDAAHCSAQAVKKGESDGRNVASAKNKHEISKKTVPPKRTDDNNDSSSESEWEEVYDAGEPMDLDNYNPDVAREGVEINISIPDPKRDRYKRRQNEFANYARQYLNRYKKGVQVDMHKVHLLGFVAHLLQLSRILSDSLLQGVALSILPNDFLGITTKRTTSVLLTKLVSWFRSTFVLEKQEDSRALRESLLCNLETKVVVSAQNYCYLFIIIGRAMKLDVRLCRAVYPVSMKAKDLIPTERQKLKSVDVKVENVESEKQGVSKAAPESQEAKPKKRMKAKPKSEKNSNINSSKKPRLESQAGTSKEGTSEKRRSRGRKTKTSYKEDASDDGDSEHDQDFMPEEPSKKRRSRGRKTEPSYKEEVSDGKGLESDEDFVPDKPMRTKQSPEFTTLKKKKANRKILSSDSDNEDEKPRNSRCIDNWAEVFLNSEGKWVCVDVVENIVDRPYEIEANASHELSYVLTVDNESKVKDVTQRYASGWLMHTRKLRVNDDWWQESLEPFAPPKIKRELVEDKLLDNLLMEQPMPTKIGDFKNHPLYVLKRHLLKFEALYPPDVPPLGFIRKEPVYARECVRILHSRESWKREGKAVKLGEEPYKLVKPRPRWDKVNKKIYTPEDPLDVYGEWQVEQWISPPCKDGKIPRNDYGNVELFKESMLPAGAVHLKLPGLNRVARKLGIDCAPAMVAFDGSASCGVIPVFDGFVVCEEYEEVMVAAWREEQINIAKREREKYETRVYGNWRRLIRGLLIREKIKSRYFGGDKYTPKPEKAT